MRHAERFLFELILFKMLIKYKMHDEEYRNMLSLDSVLMDLKGIYVILLQVNKYLFI